MKTIKRLLKIVLFTTILFLLSVNFSFSQTTPVSWSYEIYYDDGDAEDYAAWIQPGGQVAVRFTPYGHPFKVTGGSLYVGDGFFPEGGNWLGTDVIICLYDDDGTDNLPGTLIDSVRVTVNNYEWLVFDSIFDHDFFDGDFYLGMMQIGTAPDVAPIGIDTDQPTVYRSYAVQAGVHWFLSPYQDYMIRAFIDNATGNKEVLLSEGINIYPNPATSTVSISSEKQITKIEVFNQMGQKVITVENVNSKSYKMDVSQLEKGSYILNLETDGFGISRKLIVGTK